MPARLLREGILESERVDLLSPDAEVFYRRGMSKIDDHARYYAKPELLIAALYPLRIGKIQVAQVEGWLQECVAAKLIRTYEVDGKKYLEYLDFRQQIRSKSKFPEPPTTPILQGTCEASAEHPKTDAKQLPADAHLFVFESVSVSGAERGPKAAGGVEYSAEFEEAWKFYPRRQGGNPKPAAWKAWRARLREGVSPDELLAGIKRYATFTRATNREGTEFVKQASTFLGPDKHYAEPWAAPTRPVPPAGPGATPRFRGNVV